MRKKSNIVMQKYKDYLAKSQKSIDLNDIDKENEEARKDVDWDIYNNTPYRIEVQDDDDEKENEHIKMYEKNECNSSYETKNIKMKIAI